MVSEDIRCKHCGRTPRKDRVELWHLDGELCTDSSCVAKELAALRARIRDLEARLAEYEGGRGPKGYHDIDSLFPPEEDDDA